MNSRRKFLLCLSGLLLPFVAQAKTIETIRMVYADSIPPYSFFDEEQGKPRGILIDLVDKACAEAGLPCSHQIFPWKRAQHMVKTGEADGLCAPPTADRLEYINFLSESPITTLKDKLVFVRSDHPQLKVMQQASKLEDFYDFKTASFLGNSTDAALWKDHPNISYINGVSEILVLLANHRLDFYAADTIVTLYKARQLRKVKPEAQFTYFKKSFLEPKGVPVTMQLGLRKTLPDVNKKLVDLGNAIAQHITPEFEEQVISQYIDEFFDGGM